MSLRNFLELFFYQDHLHPNHWGSYNLSTNIYLTLSMAHKLKYRYNYHRLSPFNVYNHLG